MRLKLTSINGTTITMNAKSILAKKDIVNITASNGEVTYLVYWSASRTWAFSDIEGGEFASWELTDV